MDNDRIDCKTNRIEWIKKLDRKNRLGQWNWGKKEPDEIDGELDGSRGDVWMQDELTFLILLQIENGEEDEILGVIWVEVCLKATS